MKRIVTVLMLAMFSLLFSCQQPTLLSVSQTALSFENSGGNQSVTLTANKVWTASSNQGWLRVSPSSGEGNATLSISGDGNTTYDTRTGTITIISEELTQTISVTQAEGLGLLISQPEYNLSNEAQTIDVTVQANVQYTVDIDNACRDWIKQESTKGLSSNIIKFAISKNESYDGREGKITIRQTNGSLSATVVVKQSQQNGLFAEKTEYEVSYEEQQLNIKVKSNVDYDVQIDDSCKDWISRVQTKGLVESTVSLAIAKNIDVEREGHVLLKYGGIEETVRIKQGGGFVEFEDANFRAYCIENFDKDGDGVISLKEAANVSRIEVCTDDIVSLKGIEFFTNLSYLRCNGTKELILNDVGTYIDSYQGQLTILDVSKNPILDTLNCFGNQLTSLDVSRNTKLTFFKCSANKLTSLNVSKNPVLVTLECNWNQLASLDVSKNTKLATLLCTDNQLTSLDVSKNTKLTFFDCSGNQLQSLDVSKNTELTNFGCGYNQLKSLDVSKNTELTSLYCNFNQLTSIDVSKNTELTEFVCSSNQLLSLDVSKNVSLLELRCNDNQLAELQVDKNTVLKELDCKNNQLTRLDIGKNSSLKDLNCSNNRLSTIDVSQATALYYCRCQNNQLTSLDVSQNTRLGLLWCNNNLLTSLDVSNNTSLRDLLCTHNPYLIEIWIKHAQRINVRYDSTIATIKYKE